MNKRKAGLLSLFLFTVVAIIHFVHLEKWVTVSESILVGARWIFIASLILFALYKRSLTTWIMVAMAVGIEIGLDFPPLSQNLQFLSKIFLKHWHQSTKINPLHRDSTLSKFHRVQISNIVNNRGHIGSCPNNFLNRN